MEYFRKACQNGLAVGGTRTAFSRKSFAIVRLAFLCTVFSYSDRGVYHLPFDCCKLRHLEDEGGSASAKHEGEPSYVTGPTRTIGPVGCGIPPEGSSVTANAFAATPCGSFIIQWSMGPDGALRTPALIGFPSMGTSHS